jgi:hypothetical protein
MHRLPIAVTVFTAAIVGTFPVQAGHSVHQPRVTHKHVVRHHAVAASRPATVSLALDEVHTLSFRAPITTIYVGNPSIADVTMVDARHAFVQGKGYGHTNIVALNQDGAQVFGSSVNVIGSDAGGMVTLNRGAQRVTYSCAGNHCDPIPQPGDGKDNYDALNNQMNQHQNAARKASAD